MPKAIYGGYTANGSFAPTMGWRRLRMWRRSPNASRMLTLLRFFARGSRCGMRLRKRMWHRVSGLRFRA